MHGKLAAVLLAAMTVALARAASADPNVEYGESYETAYLAACGADRPAAACRCSMEVIEETLSFAAFATLVEHHGGDIRRALPAGPVKAALARRCGIADLAAPRAIDAAQQAEIRQ